MEHHYRQHHGASATVRVEHCTVPCRRSFDEAKTALEAAVPLLDRTYQRHLDAGDLAAAREALQMLPTLNRFGAQPRNFGAILRAVAAATTVPPRLDDEKRSSDTGTPTGMIKEALQYEIGNPYKAAHMVRLCGQTALYAPIRVALLREDAVRSVQVKEKDERGERPSAADRVWFEYDSPSSTMGQTGIREADDIAGGLDRALYGVLVEAAGLAPEVGTHKSKI